MNYQLLVLKGRASSQAIQLVDGVTTMGRQDGCELTVRSSQVSRRHCQLFEDNGRLIVKDLKSSNGTFVNGDRIEGQQALELDDILDIGPISFRVQQAPAAAAVESLAEVEAEPVSPVEVEAESVSPAEVEEVVNNDASGVELDEDDVLAFVSGDDETVAMTTPATTAKSKSPSKPTTVKKTKKKKETSETETSKAATSHPATEVSESAGDDAVAEFLMDLDGGSTDPEP